MDQIDSKVKKLFFYSFLDILFDKFFTYVSFFILTVIFSKETIGILGIVFGYLVFLSYISVGPESTLLRDYLVALRPTTESFRARSMALCLVGHHPVLSKGENPKRLGLKRPFELLCPRSTGLVPRSHLGYLPMDSFVALMGSAAAKGFAKG